MNMNPLMWCGRDTPAGFTQPGSPQPAGHSGVDRCSTTLSPSPSGSALPMQSKDLGSPRRLPRCFPSNQNRDRQPEVPKDHADLHARNAGCWRCGLASARIASIGLVPTTSGFHSDDYRPFGPCRTTPPLYGYYLPPLPAYVYGPPVYGAYAAPPAPPVEAYPSAEADYGDYPAANAEYGYYPPGDGY